MEPTKLYIPHSINKFVDESPDSPRYSRHKRHVFIMTKVGRPIYVRYGDEISLSSFLATLAAIVEKLCIYFSNDKTKS